MHLHRAERLLSEIVEPVIHELAEVYPDLPPIMVVGATSRDALHIAAGHTSALRATDDLDIALAVAGWDSFNAITGQLNRLPSSTSDIRFSVAGVRVDLVPFGEPVEVPDGVVTPERRTEPMSVFGFQDVLRASYEVRLPRVHPFFLPSIPGYTVLKLKAWADRSVAGNYKDASDLACAMFWYQNHPESTHSEDTVRERLYETSQGQEHLMAAEFYEPVAAVRLLIDDAITLLEPGRRRELREIWTSDTINDQLLAANLENHLLPGWPKRGDVRLDQYAQAIRSVLVDAA